MFERRPAQHAVVLVGIVVGVSALAVGYWVSGSRLGVDSSVYRAGVLAVLRGQPLYGQLAGAAGLPFIYPPIAAVLFAPLALLPAQLGWGLLAVLSVLGLGLVLRITTGESVRRSGPALALLVVAFALEPVWLTLSLGQVNILLMTLVVVDVLALPRSRCRGVLIGLAAAVKLTPLVFVPYLVLIGRRADAVRALAAFAGLTALGALLLPGDNARFWRSQLLGGVGVTHESWYGNQSLNGLIQRLSQQAGWAFSAAVVAGLVCVAVALPLARRRHARGDELGGLLIMAFAGTLASPISWTHHWVWVVPLAALLVRRARRPVLAVLALAALFTGWTFAFVPSGGTRELFWTPPQMLLGNAYVLAGLAALVVLWGVEVSRVRTVRWPALAGMCRRCVRFRIRTRR